MIKVDEQYLDRVFENYSDDELISEYLVYEKLDEIDNIYNTVFVDILDIVHDRAMRELATRFIKSKADVQHDVIKFNVVY